MISEIIEKLQQLALISDDKTKEMIEKIIQNKNSYDSSEEAIMQAVKAGDSPSQVRSLVRSIKNTFFDSIIQYFNMDFKNLISFCTSNGIILDFTGQMELDFLDRFASVRTQYEESIHGENFKYSSLDQLWLTRMTQGIPKNDIVMPASRVSSVKKVSVCNVQYDNKDYFFEVTIPTGHPTIHWMLNQGVLPHEDAKEGWKDCGIMILHPLTEKLYQKAVGLSAVDTVFEDYLELEKYLLLCDSLETYKETIKQNERAIPLLFPKGKILESGNSILRSLGIRVAYETIFGASVDRTRKYYEEELIRKYPKLINNVIRGPENLVHNSAVYYRYIIGTSQIIDFLLKQMESKEVFDVSLDKLFQATENIKGTDVTNRDRGNIDFFRLRRHKIGISKYVNDSYMQEALFLEEILSLDSFDPQEFFEKVMAGVQITEENVNAILKIKEIIISKMKNFERLDKISESDYNLLIYDLFVLRKVATSKVINNKKIFDINYDELLSHCDFSGLDVLTNDFVNNGEDISSHDITNIVENSLSSLFTFSPYRPQNNFSNFFVKTLEKIKKIKDGTERRKIALEFLTSLDLDESVVRKYGTMGQLAGELIEVSRITDLKEKITFIATYTQLFKSCNPNLINYGNTTLLDNEMGGKQM